MIDWARPLQGWYRILNGGSSTRALSKALTQWQPRYDDDVRQFDRITMDPDVMGGKPCIRGMRVTVGMIVEALAAGRTVEQLLVDFPYIDEPDIRDAQAFATHFGEFPLAPTPAMT